MQAVLDALLGRTPEAIGAVVCDDEGETVVSRLGNGTPSPEAEARAREHVPKSMALDRPVSEFLVRLVGAEACAMLRAVEDVNRRRSAGAVEAIHIAYRQIDLLLAGLPEDYYLVVVLRRPAVIGPIRRRVESAVPLLARDILE